MIGDDDDPLGHDQGHDQDGDAAEVIDLDPARRRHGSASQPDHDQATDTTDATDGGEDEDWDEDADARMLVDSPEAQRDGPLLTPDSIRAATRRPIIPPWARSWTAFTEAAGWQIYYWACTVTFHATRAPKYAALLMVRAPRGAA